MVAPLRTLHDVTTFLLHPEFHEEQWKHGTGIGKKELKCEKILHGQYSVEALSFAIKARHHQKRSLIARELLGKLQLPRG